MIASVLCDASGHDGLLSIQSGGSFTEWVQIVNRDGRFFFTFLPAGFFALGPLFSILGLVCLIVSAVWCYRIKPLEHGQPENKIAPPVGEPLKAKRAV
jgi:hypothetical protein